jgi:DNA polymerase
MEIHAKLTNFPVPDNIWAEYHLDQEINDRGVLLDMKLVRQAIEADTCSRSVLFEEMQRLTGIDNPNSPRQLKQWFESNGIITDSLSKDAVSALLKTIQEPYKQVLLLRQQLAKSSIKKYQAMEKCVCADGRVRGLFQFYGASRTGRAAGRLLQPQNLPHTSMPDLEQARALVRDGNFDALEMLYTSTPKVLSELIRTCFIPKEGRKLIVADFSSIEAVVLAWLAGEKWVIEAYAAEQDLYIKNAERMFNACRQKVTAAPEIKNSSFIMWLPRFSRRT